MKKYTIGMDVSTLIECENDGAKYYDKGEEKDLLSILKSYGTDMIRIRLWNNPYDEEGNPYGAGTCDLNYVMKLARRVKDMGLGFLLDIHYSDFWADPYKQFPPKEWQNYSFQELHDAVYNWTRYVLNTLIDAGLKPDMVQIGNEISFGMLWPQGRIEHKEWKPYDSNQYDDFCSLLRSGSSAVRSIDPSLPIIIHIERSFDKEYCQFYYSELIKQNVEFDIIGLSYYTYWHFGYDFLIDNMKAMWESFHKPMMIVEVTFAYTLEHFNSDPHAKPLAVHSQYIPESNYTVPYDMTIEGQKQFFEDLLYRLTTEVEGFMGIFDWEPGWIPTINGTWATWAALKYMHMEYDKPGNEWANQCLFDYQGNALPALEVFKKYSDLAKVDEEEE
ncbi:MAG: glycosyl hydrolase 53 family protein [Coprobacillus sp.]|nr:glycosyl hydrolase 53 family protein [Coprobacillus sp.]